MTETRPPAPLQPPENRGPATRRLLRNSGFSLGQQIAAMALAIVLVPYMLRIMGPELYGLWLILQLFNLLGFAGLAELGFQGALVRYLTRFFFAQDRASFRAVLAGGFALFLAIGAITGAMVILFAQFALVQIFPIPPAHQAQMQTALTVIGVGLLAGFPGLVVKAYFAARQELAITKIWEFADRVIFALGVFVLLQMSTSLVALILFEQAVAVVLLVVFALVAKRAGGGWFGISPRLGAGGHFSGLVRLSGSVFAANFASQGFNRLPELFVGVVLGPVTLTFYQIAARIPRVIKTLQGSLNAAVMPHIAGIDAAQRDDGGAARARFALAGLRVNYIIAVPLLLGAALYAPVLLSVWVGSEYRDLASLLAGFALFQGLFLASNYCGATLTQSSHFTLYVRVNLALVLGFGLALYLGLERFGLPLVAWALAVSGGLQFICVLVVFRAAHGIAPRSTLAAAIWGPVVGSACVGLACLAPSAFWLAQGRWGIGAIAFAFGGACYALAIGLFILRPDEQEHVRRALGRLRRSAPLVPD